MFRESKSGVYTSATQAAIDALSSSAAVLEVLRAELDRRGAGPEALAFRRALRILEAAEGVPTDAACLVLEIEKPCAEEPDAPELLRKRVRRTGT
ncbi:MAG: hypothetical protein IT378_23915 [Sandaracinaceae bacterium]|nr:hypothetical protein [Sandaracinaceae bacterium]